jgi:prepilin-type processing-associated H-X9-DG protein
MASIRDGASQTMIVAETETTTRAALPDRWFQQSGWWHIGDRARSLLSAAYPPNARKSSAFGEWSVHTWSASSLHPNGVHVLMVDGSSRFVKETVESWQVGTLTAGYPPASRPRAVWQAMATRDGGEVLADDSY